MMSHADFFPDLTSEVSGFPNYHMAFFLLVVEVGHIFTCRQAIWIFLAIPPLLVPAFAHFSLRLQVFFL